MSRLLRGIVAACLAVPAAVAWPGPSAAQQVDDGRGVPFLTLRNRTGATTPDAFYGDERSDLKAGRCTIRELDLDVFAPMVEAVAGALDDGSVEDLADTLRVSSRHLSRLFRQHLGAPPVAVAQTRRLLFAKKLINETSLGEEGIAS